MDKFTRTLTSTAVTVTPKTGAQFIEVIPGDVGAVKAHKLIKKNHAELKDVEFSVSVAPQVDRYEMTLETFMQYATKVSATAPAENQ
jgi:hypothetical protein